MFWGQNPVKPTLTNTVHTHALDSLFLHTIQTKQGGYECYHIPTHQVITQPYITVIPTTPAIIATIDALSESSVIQNLQITNLHGHLLFDSSKDPALLAGVDDADDRDTSLAECMATTLLLQECLYPTLLS